jgi:hypothetical protein
MCVGSALIFYIEISFTVSDDMPVQGELRDTLELKKAA